MLVPLAANAPSFGSAGGKLGLERRDHVARRSPLSGCRAGLNRVAEDYAVIGIPKGHRIEAFGFSNCSVHVAPASRFYKFSRPAPFPMLKTYAVSALLHRCRENLLCQS